MPQHREPGRGCTNSTLLNGRFLARLHATRTCVKLARADAHVARVKQPRFSSSYLQAYTLAPPATAPRQKSQTQPPTAALTAARCVGTSPWRPGQVRQLAFPSGAARLSAAQLRQPVWLHDSQPRQRLPAGTETPHLCAHVCEGCGVWSWGHGGRDANVASYSGTQAQKLRFTGEMVSCVTFVWCGLDDSPPRHQERTKWRYWEGLLRPGFIPHEAALTSHRSPRLRP